MDKVFSTILDILLALLVLDILVVIHELGHYIAARCCKVPIKEFAIGMGPALIKINGKHNLFSIRAFPIGGFVSMVGEDEDSDDPDAFQKKPVWQRIIVVCAGALMNLLLGLVLTTVLVLCTEKLPSTTVAGFWEGESVSCDYGLQKGDKLLKIDDTKIDIWYDIGNALTRNETGVATVVVERDGEKVTLDGVHFPTAVQGSLTYSSYDFTVYAEQKNVGTVIKHSFFRAVSLGKLVYTSLYDLARGKYGAEEVSGPVGTVEVISEAASYGFQALLYLAAFITINLGLFNLLPFPALDGGRLIFLLFELIFRKKVPAKFESVVHLVGLIILLALIAFITFGDIKGLIEKGKEAVVPLLR